MKIILHIVSAKLELLFLVYWTCIFGILAKILHKSIFLLRISLSALSH